MLRELLEKRLSHARPWPAELDRYIARQARSLGIDECDWLAGVERRPQDLAELIAAATVGHTAFFRHPEHFEALSAQATALAASGRAMRVWSAGCSTGEEAWSVALCLEQLRVEFFVLGTDVNPCAIAKARSGFYAARETNELPGYQGAQPFCASDALRSRVRFEALALNETLPFNLRSPFDAIFCRNVLIYFAPDRAAEILARVAQHVAPSGALVLSPVEGLALPLAGFTRAGPLGWFTRQTTPLGRVPRVESPTRQPTDARTAPARSTTPLLREVARLSEAARSARASSPSLGILEQASLCISAGQLERAEALLHEALSTHDDAFGWFLLAEACLRRGEKTQARIAFERSAKAKQAPPDIDLQTLQRAARRRALMLTE